MAFYSNNPSDFKIGDVVQDRQSGERGIVYRLVSAARVGAPVGIIIWLIRRREFRTFQPGMLRIIERATRGSLSNLSTAAQQFSNERQLRQPHPESPSPASVDRTVRQVSKTQPTSSTVEKKTVSKPQYVKPKASILAVSFREAELAARREIESPSYLRLTGEELDKLREFADAIYQARVYKEHLQNVLHKIQDRTPLTRADGPYKIFISETAPLVSLEELVSEVRRLYPGWSRKRAVQFIQKDSGVQKVIRFLDPMTGILDVIIRHRYYQAALASPIKRELLTPPGGNVSEVFGHLGKFTFGETRRDVLATLKSSPGVEGFSDLFQQILNIGTRGSKKDKLITHHVVEEIVESLKGRTFDATESTLERFLTHPLDYQKDWEFSGVLDINPAFWLKRRSRSIGEQAAKAKHFAEVMQRLTTSHQLVKEGELVRDLFTYAEESAGNRPLVSVLRNLLAINLKGKHDPNKSAGILANIRATIDDTPFVNSFDDILSKNQGMDVDTALNVAVHGIGKQLSKDMMSAHERLRRSAEEVARLSENYANTMYGMHGLEAIADDVGEEVERGYEEFITQHMSDTAAEKQLKEILELPEEMRPDLPSPEYIEALKNRKSGRYSLSELRQLQLAKAMETYTNNAMIFPEMGNLEGTVEFAPSQVSESTIFRTSKGTQISTLRQRIRSRRSGLSVGEKVVFDKGFTKQGQIVGIDGYGVDEVVEVLDGAGSITKINVLTGRVRSAADLEGIRKYKQSIGKIPKYSIQRGTTARITPTTLDEVFVEFRLGKPPRVIAPNVKEHHGARPVGTSRTARPTVDWYSDSEYQENLRNQILEQLKSRVKGFSGAVGEEDIAQEVFTDMFQRGLTKEEIINGELNNTISRVLRKHSIAERVHKQNATSLNEKVGEYLEGGELPPGEARTLFGGTDAPIGAEPEDIVVNRLGRRFKVGKPKLETFAEPIDSPELDALVASSKTPWTQEYLDDLRDALRRVREVRQKYTEEEALLHEQAWFNSYKKTLKRLGYKKRITKESLLKDGRISFSLNVTKFIERHQLWSTVYRVAASLRAMRGDIWKGGDWKLENNIHRVEAYVEELLSQTVDKLDDNQRASLYSEIRERLLAQGYEHEEVIERGITLFETRAKRNGQTIKEFMQTLLDQFTEGVFARTNITFDEATQTFRIAASTPETMQILQEFAVDPKAAGVVKEVLGGDLKSKKGQALISRIVDANGNEYEFGGTLAEVVGQVPGEVPDDILTNKITRQKVLAPWSTAQYVDVPLPLISGAKTATQATLLKEQLLQAVKLADDAGFVGLPQGQTLEHLKELLDPNRRVIGLDIETMGATRAVEKAKVFDILANVAIVDSDEGKTLLEIAGEGWVKRSNYRSIIGERGGTVLSGRSDTWLKRMLEDTHGAILQAQSEAGDRGLTILVANQNFDLGFLYAKANALAKQLDGDEAEAFKIIADDFKTWAQKNQADILLLQAYSRPRIIHSLEGTSIVAGVKELGDTRQHVALEDVQQMLRTFKAIKPGVDEVLETATQPMADMFKVGGLYMLPQSRGGTSARFGRDMSELSNRVFEFMGFTTRQTEHDMSPLVGFRFRDILNDEIVPFTPDSPNVFGVVLSSMVEIDPKDEKTMTKSIIEDLANRRLRRLLKGELTEAGRFEYETFDIRYHAATWKVGDKRGPTEYIEEVIKLLEENPNWVEKDTPAAEAIVNANVLDRIDRLGISKDDYLVMRQYRFTYIDRYKDQLVWATDSGSDIRLQKQFEKLGKFYGEDWIELHKPFFEALERRPLTLAQKQEIIRQRFGILFGEGGLLHIDKAHVPTMNVNTGYTPRVPGITNPLKINAASVGAAELDIEDYLFYGLRNNLPKGQTEEEVISNLLGVDPRSIYRNKSLMSEKYTAVRQAVASRLLTTDAKIGEAGITTALAEQLGLNPQELIDELRSSDNPLRTFAERFVSTIRDNEAVAARLASATVEAEWLFPSRKKKISSAKKIKDTKIKGVKAVTEQLLPEPVARSLTEERQQVRARIESMGREQWESSLRTTSLYTHPSMLAFREGITPDRFLTPYGFPEDFTLADKTPEEVLTQYNARGRKVLTRMLAQYDLGARGIPTGYGVLKGDPEYLKAQAEEIRRVLGLENIGDLAKEVTEGNLGGAGAITVAIKEGEGYVDKTLADLVGSMEGWRTSRDKKYHINKSALGYDIDVPQEIKDILWTYYGIRKIDPLQPLKAPAVQAIQEMQREVIESGGKGPSVARTALLQANTASRNGAERLGQVISNVIPENYTVLEGKIKNMIHGPGIVVAGLGLIGLGLLATDRGIKQRNPYDIEYNDEVEMEQRGIITNETLRETPGHYVITGKIKAKTKSDIDQAQIANAIHSAMGISATEEPEKTQTITDQREPITKQFANRLMAKFFNA